MKKTFAFMLTIALLFSLSIPATATEVTAEDASDLRSIAYMNLDTADEQTRTNILAARNKIMFSTSWVADDVNGWVLDENGVVIETLPHFSEVFPSDWDVPVMIHSRVQHDLMILLFHMTSTLRRNMLI